MTEEDEIKNTYITEVLKKTKIKSPKKLLGLPELELSRITKLPELVIHNLVEKVSKNICSAGFVRGDHLKTAPKIPVGCLGIDTFLRGGIPCQGITELSGESATGKTQFCLQLSIQTQLRTKSAIAYVCTEDSFPIKRLYQMASHLNALHTMDNIFIHQVGDMPSLWTCLNQYVPALREKHTLKLLIIDSVAALIRCEFEFHQSKERAEALKKLGNCLHDISRKNSLAILCINQVTANFEENSTSSLGFPNSKFQNIPALGLSWSNIVTTRLFLSRTDGIRTLQSLTSPYMNCKLNCQFKITSGGLEDV